MGECTLAVAVTVAPAAHVSAARNTASTRTTVMTGMSAQVISCCTCSRCAVVCAIPMAAAHMPAWRQRWDVRNAVVAVARWDKGIPGKLGQARFQVQLC